jgi:eukaryotic-like serine/threonine-protein kinase
MSTPTEASRYFAFISYSHQDRLWADWLHKTLETYRVPDRLVGQKTTTGAIPRRLLPVFRDRDDLASAGDLTSKVNEALALSSHLIVICSPHSAQSRWVNAEVLAFKRLGGSDRIYCLIVTGEPDASSMPGHEAEECFAPALRFAVDVNGHLTQERAEPVAADVRPGQDSKANAKLKLIAGMLDVGFDVLKQRELHRRAARMTAITALAVLVTLLTTTLAVKAIIARSDAERRQKQAEDLVGFMLGDLNDKLAQVARLDVMEAVDDHAMSYFQSLPTADVTDEALAQRAKALERIGTVRMEQGRLPLAIESYQVAAKLSGALADAAPLDMARQVAYSHVLAFIGMANWYQGKLDAAQQSFESAQTVLHRAKSSPSGDPDLIFLLTSIENNIGHVLEARGRLDEAVAHYRSMLALCRELTSGKVVKTEWTSQLGAAHNNLGKIALMRGDLATAVAEYAADDAIESDLSARDPKNNEQRQNMLRVRAILGRTLALTGDIAAGTDDLQQAIQIATELTKVDPAHAVFREVLALYSSQLSRLRRLAGDLPQANALTAESLRILSALAEQDAANAGWQQELAEVQIEQGAQSLAGGRYGAARAQAQAALGILRGLSAKQPDDRGIILATAGAKLLLARCMLEAEHALQLRSEALAALQSVADGRGDPRLLALEAEALLALGRNSEVQPVVQQLWRSGYRDPGLVALLQREHIDYPLNGTFQQRLQAAVAGRDRS